jgi:ATP-dependent RNA helicase DDX19/DBP5
MEQSSTTSPPPPTKSWADQADDEDANPSSSSAAETETPSLDELTIDEDKKSSSKLLDDPDDANIQAVRFCSTSFISLLSLSNLGEKLTDLGFMNFDAGYIWRYSIHIGGDI